MGGRGAVPLAVAVWIGLLAGGSRHPPAILLALAAVAAVLAWRSTGARASHALLLAVALAAAARGAAGHAMLDRERAAIHDDAPVRLCGRLAEPPLLESGVALAVVAVSTSDPPLPPGTRVRVRLPDRVEAEWGDRVRLTARLATPGPSRNPGGFEPKAAADAEAIAASGIAFTAVLSSGGLGSWPRPTVMRWRRAIERSFAGGLDSAAHELVTPLVTGDRSALSSDLNASFKAAGLVHLLALSGLHVTWMAGMARGLIATLGRGVTARALAGAACALVYAGIAGPLPSLMRAVATECFATLARLSDRALDPIQALALSVLACLIAAPGWALDLGFQLSCAATLGLVTVGTLDRAIPHRFRRWVALLSPTLSAQVTAAPLLLLRMHALSWVAPIANLAAVPVSGILLAAAWLAALWDLGLPGTARAAFAACEALARLLQVITERSAALPHASFATGAGAMLPGCAALGGVLLAAGSAPRRALAERMRGVSAAQSGCVVLGAALVAGAMIAAVGGSPRTPLPGSAWVVVLDVDQGDAIAVGLADGWWLVDAGPRIRQRDAGERVVAPFLRWAGVRALSGLVLTHDDLDHTGGALAVERAFAVDRVLAPPPRVGLSGPGPRYHARSVARGDTLHRDPTIAVLWPPPPGPEAPEVLPWTDNHGAVVLDLACDSTHALLLADADAAAEESLAVDPGVALLKVGHHGSRTSSSEHFLARARPRWAAISCGRWNRFGHPHPEVVARLLAVGARVLRTDQEGALWFELDARGIRPVDWRRETPAPRERASVPRTGMPAAAATRSGPRE